MNNNRTSQQLPSLNVQHKTVCTLEKLWLTEHDWLTAWFIHTEILPVKIERRLANQVCVYVCVCVCVCVCSRVARTRCCWWSCVLKAVYRRCSQSRSTSLAFVKRCFSASSSSLVRIQRLLCHIFTILTLTLYMQFTIRSHLLEYQQHVRMIIVG